MGYIDHNGVYQREGSTTQRYEEASTYKDWNHTQQRERFAKEVLQPYDNKGNPSKDFIRAWPAEAKKYFTDDQLKEFGD